MRTPTILTPLLLLSALPALAQKVYVDYDNATAFSEYRTFQLVETQEDLRDTSRTSHELVVSELRRYAIEGGLRRSKSDPDAYVAYYTADRGHLRLVLTDLRYAYGPISTRRLLGRRRRDAGAPLLHLQGRHADRRRLGSRAQQLVWRGMATSALSSDPEKNDKKIEKALKKIMKRWDEAKGYRVRAIRQMKVEEEN